MPVKLIITLPRNMSDFIDKSRSIKTALTDNANFRDLSSEFAADLAKLPDTIDRMQNAFDEAKNHDSLKIAMRDQVRQELSALLGRIAKSIELVAKGDVAIMKSTGFDLSVDQGKKSKVIVPLEAPELKLKHGTMPGTIIVSARAIPGAASYEVHITSGDPTHPENFNPFGIFAHCSHINVPDLSAGQNCSVRMRAIGVGGVGVWSAPCTLMSL